MEALLDGHCEKWKAMFFFQWPLTIDLFVIDHRPNRPFPNDHWPFPMTFDLLPLTFSQWPFTIDLFQWPLTCSRRTPSARWRAKASTKIFSRRTSRHNRILAVYAPPKGRRPKLWTQPSLLPFVDAKTVSQLLEDIVTAVKGALLFWESMWEYGAAQSVSGRLRVARGGFWAISVNFSCLGAISVTRFHSDFILSSFWFHYDLRILISLWDRFDS